MTLSLFEIAALLLALSALFGWFNHTVLKLPHTIGLLVMALVASIALLGLEAMFSGVGHYRYLARCDWPDRFLCHSDGGHAGLPAVCRRFACGFFLS